MKKLILLLFVFMLSCGPKPKTQEQEQEQAPVSTNSDIDEVVTYEEVEVTEPHVVSESASEVMILESSPSPEMLEQVSKLLVIDNDIVLQVETPPVVDYLGRLVYEIPSEMLKFKTYTVEVRISENKTDVSILENIEPIVDTTIRTSELMQVELVDPTNQSFRIVSQSSQQLVEPNEFTTWIFYVTPLVHGENQISVVVSIIKDGYLKQTVYKDIVIVQTSTWLEVTTFFGNYWQWIIGFLVGVVIPFGIWFYKYLKRTKKTS